MMYEEFLNLTGSKVSHKTYTEKIEPQYTDSPLAKQDFCRQYVDQAKRTQNNEIEIQRSNVTLAAFLSYCKAACEKKGLWFEIYKKDFEKPDRECDISYFVKDGRKICWSDGYKTEMDASEAPCQAETIRIKPFDYQTYVLNFDGSLYNEICEFTFDDEKTGHGYYYQVSK